MCFHRYLDFMVSDVFDILQTDNIPECCIPEKIPGCLYGI